MNKLLKLLAYLFAGLCFVFAGCSNFMDSDDSNNSSKYGSIIINNSSVKALEVNSEITKSVVTVSGYGMSSISETADISNGKGSVTINNVPVGSNRVITIQAYNGSTKLTGIVMRGICDVNSGSNTVTVDWSTTPLGNVYNALLSENEDISSYSETEEEQLSDAIPSGYGTIKKACLVDADSIAADFIDCSVKDSSNYILTTGSVTFTAENAEGYSVKVGDPISVTTTVSSDGTYTISNVAPGSWLLYITDADENVTTKTIKVTSDTATDIGVVGETFYIFISASSAPALWAWETSGSSVELTKAMGYTWTSQPTMTAVTSTYMTDPTGWYMLDVSSVTSGGEVAFKINSGSTIASEKTATFWYDAAGTVGTAGTFYDSDPTNVEPSLTAKYSSGTVTLTSSVDVTSASVTVSAGSNSTTVTSFTDCEAEVDVSSWNLDEGDVISIEGTINGYDVEASVKVTAFSGVKIYISASSAPTIWAWQPSGLECTTLMGYSWSNQPTMSAATDLNYNSGWYVLEIESDYYTEDKAFSFILNSGSTTITTTKTATFWYDAAGAVGTAGEYYDSDPTSVPDPVTPTLTISPATGKEIGTNTSIKVTADFGYDTPSVATVTINGTTKTLSEGTNTFAVSDYATTAGVTITVSGTLTNSAGTATVSATYTTKILAEDPFCWENLNCYFVLTDRFYNGNSKNDHSYYRQNADNNSTCATSYNNTATFHGGDIAGLTAKMDYFKKLGVNAIWITAPYEQAHGWVTSGGNGFPHYAFHGYYTLDWTYMDQNMGTIEEFRTFVQTCHANGIRVIMDIVMNHTGYNTVEDMMTYKFGHYSALTMSHGWLANAGSWTANPNSVENSGYTYDSDYWNGDNWENWWGKWIRSFNYSSCTTGNSTYDQCGTSGLPDVRSEMTDIVDIPDFLQTKWAAETDSTTVSTATGNTCGNKYGDYKLPAVSDVDWYDKSGDWRESQKGCPVEYQIMWLSAWVREFGIDGFRCDTAKHVQPKYWGMLKDACESALAAWRDDSTKTDTSGAKDWDEGFWMTGECFTYFNLSGGRTDSSYFGTAKFDSMINFSYNSAQSASTVSNYPSTSDWASYANTYAANVDTDGNGNYDNALTYLSSHDTSLCRASDQKAVGTMFELLPGGIQIFYGDECSRPQDFTDCGDSDMMTRGDMDFTINTGCTSHWGKVGNFRKYNPAVGAGTLVGSSVYKRSYSGAAGDNSVAISISGTTVDVSDLFDDGTTVYNWYDGTSATVSSGSVTFSSGVGSVDQPILVSDKNPADYGLSF